MDSIFNPTFQNDDTASKIVYALERLSQAFKVNLWRAHKTHGLSPLQIQILIFLRFQNQEDRNVSQLALDFNVTKATISEAVRVLEKKEYITKVQNPDDARGWLLQLHAKGETAVQELAFFANDLRQYVLTLPAPSQDSLYGALLMLVNQLQVDGHISMQRMCHSCQHFVRQAEEPAHFCRLLNQPIKEADIRINCLEHQPVL